jgi:hypothetical protein
MASIWCVVVVAGLAACTVGSDDATGGEPGEPGEPGDTGDDGDGPSFTAAHPRIYLTPNRARLTKQLGSGRPSATRFKATIDRWVGGAEVYGVEAWNAALIGQLTGDAKYCAAAVKAIDAQVIAEQAKISAGSAPDVAHDSYLYVGDQVGDLALVYDWCYAEIGGDRRAAWLAFANQAVWNVWNFKSAKWGGKQMAWSGWSVSDPSDNYYYSFLRATMLLGLAAHDDSPDAGAWLIQFHDTKLLGELVPTFDADLAGGGSREGTGYGVAMRRLFHLYDLWEGSTGESIASRTGHTRASMLAFIHQTMPTLDRVAPTGDHSRDSTAAFFDYHRDYLQELISLFPSDPLAARAQALLADSTVPAMDNQFMYVYDFLYDRADVAPTSLDGLGTAYHAPGIGELYVRSGWDEHATWVNLIAGPFTQSHAHQDQGSLMIYKDGWLAYDANVDSKSGLAQQLDAHSLVRIVDGGATVEQRRNTASPLVALHRGAGFLHAATDLTPAYKQAAAVQKVQREIIYLEPDAIVVYDRVTTRAGSQQIWQLVSPEAPAISGTRATITAAGHTLTVERVAPASAASSSFDFRSDSDFTGGFRLDETVAGGDNRFLHVLFIDGAVGTVTPGTDGATISVGGKTVVVQFHRDRIGGSLTIAGQTTTLGVGVDTLSE